MISLYLSLLLLFMAGIVFLLYIPLPLDIADRRKLQVFEFILRLGNEYAGDLVETLLGARARNTFTRHLMALGFIVPFAVPDFLTVRDDTIAGVRVRVYTPKKRKTEGALVFIHGGGFSTMKPEYYDGVIFGLVRKLGVMTFSIDYRLAPEHPYPAAVEDCEAVVKELHDNKDIYSFDRSKICLVGDSAGGNLSAVTCQRLAAASNNFIKCQVLIYPVTHMFGYQSSSYLGYYQRFKGTALLNPRAMARWTLFYLGIEPTRENVKKLLRNQHMSENLRKSIEFEKLIDPSRLPVEVRKDEHVEPSEVYKPDPELSEKFASIGCDPSISPIFGISPDVPATMVLTAGYDILRDEGILYAKRLQEVGVQCQWKHFPKAYHGLFNMPGSPHRIEMAKEVASFLEAHLK